MCIARSRIRTHRVGGGGTTEPLMIYRRDQPEDILPALLQPNNAGAPAAAAWTFGAWGNAVTAAQMTADAYIVGVQPTCNLQFSNLINADVTNNRMYQIELGETILGVDTMFARVRGNVGGRLVTAGFAGGENATGRFWNHVRRGCQPHFITAGNPVRIRSAKNDALVSVIMQPYIIAIPSLYDYFTVPVANIVQDIIEPLTNEVAITAGGGVFVFGAWTPVFVAAADYLCTGVGMNPGGIAANNDGQLELRVNDGAGSVPLQARSCNQEFGLSPVENWCEWGDPPFMPPFRVNSGETIEARYASQQPNTVMDVQLELIQMTGW